MPAEWRRISHGSPGLTGERLVALAHLATCGGRPGANGWPTVDHIDYSGAGVPHTLVRHPLDDGVWLADASALGALLTDAARTIATLRDEGHCVLVHCVAAQSRTPTVAIAYAMH